MGHSPYQLSVLKNGTAAHPLHDPAGGGDQVRIRDGDHHFPAVRGVWEPFQNFNGILPHLVPGHIGPDRCRSLHGIAHRQSLTRRKGAVRRKRAENAAVGIGAQRAKVAGQVKIAPQLPGTAAAPLLHRLHGGGQDGAAAEGHQSHGIAVGDPVSQRAEIAGCGIVIGHGADARHAVPDPCADAADALFIPFRLHREGQRAALPLDLQRRGVRSVFLQQGLELLRGGHGLAAALHDHVAGFQAAGPGRSTALRQLYHHHAPGKQLHPYGVSHRDQTALDRLRGQSRRGTQQQGQHQCRPMPQGSFGDLFIQQVITPLAGRKIHIQTVFFCKILRFVLCFSSACGGLPVFSSVTRRSASRTDLSFPTRQKQIPTKSGSSASWIMMTL